MVWPAFYDIGLYPLERLGLARWRKEIIGRARGRVLEIAGGTGANLQYYNHDCRLVLTDPNESMLRRAAIYRANLSSPRIMLVTDAQHLPFAPASFDTVVATLAFCTIPQPEIAFQEVRRVLRPEGMLLLLEHIRSHQPWLAWIQNKLTPTWSQFAGGCHLNRDTLDLARKNGFTMTDIRYRMNHSVVAATLAVTRC